MTAILLSVRPIYARALLAGTKTMEVRRRFPQQPEGTTVYLYSSTPDRAILGTLRLGAIDRPNADDVWRLYRHEIEIDKSALSSYLADRDSAAILRMSDPRLWEHSVSLDSLRRSLGIHPPQSFRYLNQEQVLALEQLRGHRRESPVCNTPKPSSSR